MTSYHRPDPEAHRPNSAPVTSPPSGADYDDGRTKAGRSGGLTGVVIVSLLLSVVAAMVGWRLGESFRGGLDQSNSDGDSVIEQMRLPTLSGGVLGPSDLIGEVVVLDFWATWCGPCHVQAKILDGIFEDYEGRLKILAVNVAENRATVESFVEGRPFPYPVLLDLEGDTSAAGDVFGLPTTVIIGRDGEVAFRSTGVTTDRRLREVLDRLLAS